MLRSCYTAPARFQKGGPVGSIRWYFAPEGAAIYTAPNIFFPLSQTLQYKPTDGVGELYGGGYPWFKGVPFSSWAGDAAHGTEADFLGETEYTGPTADGEVPLCAFDPLLYVACPTCEDSLLPRHFSVVIETPDYPEIDGIQVDVDYTDDDGNCEWHGSTVVGDTFVGVDLFSSSDLDPHTLLVEIEWPASPYGEFEMSNVIGEPDFSCLPFGFDYLGEAVINSIPSGNFVHVRTGTASLGSRAAGIELGGETSFVVTTVGGLELGGVTEFGTTSAGGIELGGELSGLTGPPIPPAGGIELGCESDSGGDHAGGIELSGHLSGLIGPENQFAGGIELGSESDSGGDHAGGIELGGESS